MSGFVVILEPDGKPLERGLLRRMTERLADHGPDGFRIWSEGSVGMGHALHKTTDQDDFDRQPASLDGAVHLVSSARIDGRQALVDSLGDTGTAHLDRTPDSELILRAFRKWGNDSPAHFLGDFSFAIWEGRTARLLCARDPFGMRQLYYARAREALLVSNSLYCLLGHPGISRRLDDKAVAGFLLFGDHTWMDKGITAFADVRAVPPAHRLVVDKGRFTLERYWDFPVEVPLRRYRRERDYVEHFRNIFEQAVADRLRGRSVVIAMSGGMDSSAMAAMARKVGDAGGGLAALHGVTVLFDGIMPSEERRYASLSAGHLGMGMRFLDGGRFQFLEPPVATTRPLEIYNAGAWLEMYRVASELGPVVMHGEGGDSLFAYSSGLRTLSGVGPWRIARDLVRLRRRYGKWPGLGTGLTRYWRKLVGGVPAPGPTEPFPYPDWLDGEFETRLGLRERWRHVWYGKPSRINLRHPGMQEELTAPDWHVEEQFLHPGFTQPEVRDPFLDLRLVDLMLALPPMPWSFRKYMLRLAMAEDLPQEILGRPKTPLGEVHVALIQRPEAHWIEDWRPPPELDAYLDPGKLPLLRGGGSDGDQLYVGLRPLLLDRWLTTLRQTLDAGL